MAPNTRRPGWYRCIVALATILSLVCVIPWTIQPAFAQPSYCKPIPKEPLVGCWIAAGDNGIILRNVYVYTSENTFYEFPRFQGIPASLDKQHPSGFWRFQPNNNGGELVISRMAYNQLFGNIRGPEMGSALYFSRNNDSFDETITWSPNPDIRGSRAHLERLGGSSTFSVQSLDQAAQELANAWDKGGNIAEVTRGFFDFGRACIRDQKCRKELKENFDWEKWWSIEIGTLFILLPEVRVARLAETTEGGSLLRLSRTFSKQRQKVDLTDTSTWPKPPIDGNLREGLPSRTKPTARGEKSLYDEDGGEWRMHLPDKYHNDPHWNYKPLGNNSEWEDIPMK